MAGFLRLFIAVASVASIVTGLTWIALGQPGTGLGSVALVVSVGIAIRARALDAGGGQVAAATIMTLNLVGLAGGPAAVL